MKRLLSRLLPVVLGLLVAESASAQTATFSVQAAVAKKCRVSTAAATINLGTYDPVVTHAAAPLVVNTNNFFTINCTKNTAFSLYVDSNAATMLGGSGGELLNYSLFKYSTANGFPTAAGDADLSGSSTSIATNYLFGITVSVPGGQDVAPDTYTDSILATVNF